MGIADDVELRNSIITLDDELVSLDGGHVGTAEEQT
jgi:hypothetical protein